MGYRVALLDFEYDLAMDGTSEYTLDDFQQALTAPQAQLEQVAWKSSKVLDCYYGIPGVSGKGGLGQTRTRTRIRTRTPGTRKGSSRCCCATTIKGVLQDTSQDGMVCLV